MPLQGPAWGLWPKLSPCPCPLSLQSWVAEQREGRAGLGACPQGWEHSWLCSLPALFFKGSERLEHPTKVRKDLWALLLSPVSPVTFQLTCSLSLSPHPAECQSKALAAPAASWALKACQPGQGCQERNGSTQGLVLLLPLLQAARGDGWDMLCRDGVRCVTMPSSPGLAHHGAPKGLAVMASGGRSQQAQGGH